MIEHVIFTSEADGDVTAAYQWYEEREPGMGEDFLRRLEACILTLRRHPQLYPVAADEFRRAMIRRFPYEVFYEPAADTLFVYAVFHCSQNPAKWRERLRLGE